jgi:hypothetical protein
MAAQRKIRLERACHQRRVLRHAVVHRLAPIAIGPAIEAAVAYRGQVVRRGLVAEAVAFDDGP